MADKSLGELRDEARARHRAATRKASRLRANGVEVTGTAMDPRRDLSRIKRYNRAQLESYIQQLNSFTSRSAGWVRLGEGVATRQEWNEYKRLERKENALSRRELRRFSNQAIPGTGLTVAEREQTMMPTRLQASPDHSNRVYRPKNRKPENINGPEALRKLIAQQEDRLNRSFKPRQLKRQRANFMEMLDTIGVPELNEKAKQLNNEQFNLLWNYTQLPRTAARNYHIRVQEGQGREDDINARILDTGADEIGDLIDWALEYRGEAKAARKSR